MPILTVVGDVNVDLLASPIRSYPKKDLQLRIPWIRLEVGGCAAHLALATSKLGIKTRLIGLVGDDLFADYIMEKMKKFKVENRVRKARNQQTGITFAISFEDGSRSLLTFRGTNSIFSIRHFSLKEIEGKALFIAGYNLLENLQRDVNKLLTYAKKKGMLTCLEPDLKSGINCDIEELKRNLRKVDFFFLNLEEGRILTSRKDEMDVANEILNFGCKAVILKLGKKGCLIATKEFVYRIKGLDVRVINPTGAGDMFNAGFVMGWLKFKDLREAGKFANATAAYSIARLNEERYPNFDTVEKIVKKRYG